MNPVVIIGSGPAAFTAAIYTARANLNPVLYEGFLAGGIAAGGQLTTTTEVENFPGFAKGISGPELMREMRAQAERFGTNIVTETIERVEFSPPILTSFAEDSSEPVQSRCVIIATGASARRMNLLGEDKYWQKGISACAVCDGALPLFRDKNLAVIGGGDSACEEANFLTKYGQRVYLIHRRDKLRASNIMQKRVKENPKIEIIWNAMPIEAKGDGSLLNAVLIEDTKSHQQTSLEVQGLFYAIGHTPNTAFLNEQIEVDASQYLVEQKTLGNCHTNVSGVFAAGDVMDKRYRQAVTAAGSGCMAALEVEKYLTEHGY